MDRFLFQPLDGSAVAWFRIAFALTIPWFFWSRGFQPKEVVPESFHWLYEHFWVSPGHYMLVVFLCGLFGLGWRPRLCGFVLVFLLCPLMFLNSGPVSRQVLLFSLLAFSFVPSGTVKVPWSSKHRGSFIHAGPCWPIRLIQLQLTFLYGANALAKSSPMYLRGEALMDMSVTQSNFNVDLSSGTLVLGVIVMPVALAAVLSMLAELTLALGFWFKRLRWMVFLLGISFHLVLMKIVTIFMLHYASIFLYLAFLLPLIARNKIYEKDGT